MRGLTVRHYADRSGSSEALAKPARRSTAERCEKCISETGLWPRNDLLLWEKRADSRPSLRLARRSALGRSEETRNDRLHKLRSRSLMLQVGLESKDVCCLAQHAAESAFHRCTLMIGPSLQGSQQPFA